jgi:hypothetical protein
LQNALAWGLRSYWGPSRSTCKEEQFAISFFDDGEDDPPAAAPRTARRPAAAAPGAPQRPRRPRPAGGPDERTLRNRRLAAAVVAIVLIVVIALAIKSCANSEKVQSLKDYNRAVSTLAQESDSQVARPLFSALAGAAGKPALNVEVQVDQLRIQAQGIARHAKTLSVPGEMTGAQRALLLALDLRVEGLEKVSAQLPRALGSHSTQSAAAIAGAMEVFLASDVLYSQRVAPLIQETLRANGVHEVSTAPSRFLPNLGWLEASTTLARLTGHGQSEASQTATPGSHGSSALVGVAVGTNTLAPEPTINHVSGGGNPVFTVTVENDGNAAATNVKVDVTVTAAGRQYKASHAIDSTQPGSKVNVEIPVTGIPAGVAAKIETSIEPVTGEEDLENNKGVYLAVFSK